MEKYYQAEPDVAVIPSSFVIPGMGVIPANAFVLKAKEPVLVDTGLGIESEEFMQALESIIDLQDLKWVWLTHDDADHTGNVRNVLEAAPNARLVANSLAVLRMTANWQVPMEWVHWLNPGETISAGDRELAAVRPPLFDNPSTIGLFDSKSEVLFSADCCGALIPELTQDADNIAEEVRTQGMLVWARLDSPWIHLVRQDEFQKKLDVVRRLSPKMIFSAHLPPARGKTEQFMRLLGTLPDLEPFTAPDQKALEQMLPLFRGREYTRDARLKTQGSTGTHVE